MNTFIQAQCRNMIMMVKTFEHACQMAAHKDDGKISREEEKTLKAITAAAEKFKKELTKISE